MRYTIRLYTPGLGWAWYYYFEHNEEGTPKRVQTTLKPQTFLSSLEIAYSVRRKIMKVCGEDNVLVKVYMRELAQ